MTEVVTPPAPPAPPSTPAEATTLLTQRMADRTWSDAVLAGKHDQVKEWKELHALAAEGDENLDVTLAVAGLSKPVGYTTSSDIEMRGTASHLREIGLDDAVIKQALLGQPVSKTEFDAVSKWKAQKMADHEFTKRLLAGDGEPRRQLTAANIIITNGYKGQ